MPVYNAEKYLVEALLSVLNQTYANIELIAVNDGSTDDSLEILNSFAQKDNRLKIINQKNTGIVGALNNAIRHASGEYLARIDGDDSCFLNRIEKQLPLIEADPTIVLVASSFEVMDEDSEFIYREIMLDNDRDIKRAMFLKNPIAHGSVLLRKSAVADLGGYSSECGPTEDYELWTRLAKVGRFTATEDILYRWRQNRKGITLTNNHRMSVYMEKNLSRYWRENQAGFKALTRSEIIEIGSYYINKYRKYGIDAKHVAYHNIAQFSIRMLKHGRWKDCVFQLVALASTGRTGTKYALKRIFTIIQIQVSNLFSANRQGT